MQEYVITENEKGQRLDKYVRRILPQAPSSFIYKMMRKKNITLNGHRAEGKEVTEKGDHVKFFLSDETFQKMGGMLREQSSVNVRRSGSCGGQEAAAGKMPSKIRTFVLYSEEEEKRPRESETVKARQVSGEGTCSSEERRNSSSRLAEAEKAYRLLSGRYPSLQLVYEDADIAAAYKPAGVLSQKAEPGDASLNEWFLGLLAGRGEVTERSLYMFTPSVQNRLDRNTEGIVLLAKTLPGSHLLTMLQREHRLKKFYRMIVLGRVEKAGAIEGYLSKDSAANTVRVFDRKREGSVYTRTEYRPVSYGRLSADAGSETVTLVEAQLITGKTHQLRAHFARMGHPILGDPKYGNREANDRAGRLGVKAQLLLCQRVEFPELSGDFAALSGKVIACREPLIYEKVMREGRASVPRE